MLDNIVPSKASFSAVPDALAFFVVSFPRLLMTFKVRRSQRIL